MTTESDMKARSPWSALLGVKSVQIAPAVKAIEAQLTLPGSKSFSNRALILAAFAKGESTITGLLKSDDTYWCLDTLKALGADVTITDETVVIKGVAGQMPCRKELYIGAAGTTARFLPGLLAALGNDSEWCIKASKRMSKRPIEPLITALHDLGANIDYTANQGEFPINIQGKALTGGRVVISGKMSSQFISGLLIASPCAKETVTIEVTDGIVQPDYIQITVDMMKQFGAHATYRPDFSEIIIQPQAYEGTAVHLEPDASTACYFFALAAITGGTVCVNQLSYFSMQPDVKFVDFLETMGCTVERGDDSITVCGPKQLKGNFAFDMKACSDQALTLAAIAPFADGPITITNVAHIRHHESDRIRVACALLTQLGISVTEQSDGLTIHPGTPKPALLETFDDHRVAMAFSLVGTVVSGVEIADPGCTSKTCPDYFSFLQQVGVQVTYRT